MKFSFILSTLFFLNLNLQAQTEERAVRQKEALAPEEPREEMVVDEPAEEDELPEEDYRNAEMIDESEEGNQEPQNQDDCDCGQREEEESSETPTIFPEESVFLINPAPVVPLAPTPPPAPAGPDYTKPQVGPEYYKQYDSGNYQYQSFGPMGRPQGPPVDQFGQPIPQPLGPTNQPTDQ